MILPNALFLLAALQGTPSKDLKSFPLIYGVQVSFPSEPIHDIVPLPKGNSERFTARLGGIMFRVSIDLRESSKTSKEIEDNPGGKTVLNLLDQFGIGVNKNFKGKMIESQFGSFHGYPAKRWRFETARTVVFALRVLTPSKSVGMLISMPKEELDLKLTQAFFDSLAIEAPPTQQH